MRPAQHDGEAPAGGNDQDHGEQSDGADDDEVLPELADAVGGDLVHVRGPHIDQAPQQWVVGVHRTAPLSVDLAEDQLALRVVGTGDDDLLLQVLLARPRLGGRQRLVRVALVVSEAEVDPMEQVALGADSVDEHVEFGDAQVPDLPVAAEQRVLAPDHVDGAVEIDARMRQESHVGVAGAAQRGEDGDQGVHGAVVVVECRLLAC